jgi:hypothetical protein
MRRIRLVVLLSLVVMSLLALAGVAAAQNGSIVPFSRSAQNGSIVPFALKTA